MNDDRGFSFSVSEVKSLIRLQGQYRREYAERLMVEREVDARRWSERVLRDGKYRA